MRKRILHTLVLFLIIFFIIILIIYPWATGLAFKRHYYHFIDLINQERGVKIDILEYNTGWFNSYAKVRVSMLTNGLSRIPQIQMTPVSFIIDEHIIHGIVIFDLERKQIQLGYAKMHSHVHLAPELESTLLGKVTTDRGVMQIDTLSELDGDWSGQMHTPPLALDLKKMGKLSWAGMDGNFKIIIRNDSIKHMFVHTRIGSLAINDVQNSFIKELSIQPISYKYDSVHEKLGLWSGNTNIYTDGVSILTPDNAKIEADNIEINTKFGISTDTFYNTNIAVNAKNITTTNTKIPVISALHLALSADNFSAEGITTYINFFKSKIPEAMQDVDVKTIESLLVHTIMTTSALNADVSLNTSLGDFSAKSKSLWKANAPAPNTLADVVANSQTQIFLKASDAIVNKVITIYTENKRAGNKPTPPVNKELSQINPPANAAKQQQTDVLNQQLAQFLQQNKIAIPDFVQILDWEKQQQSITTFTKNIDNLNLPADVAAQLKQTYASQQKNLHLLLPSFNLQTSEQLLQDLITIGYIQKENNNYVTTVIIENGAMKINGSIIDTE